MDVTMTQWIPGSVKPIRDGWYIVDSDDHAEAWISARAVARFENGRWQRPLGWPTPWPHVDAYCYDCAERTGRVIEAGCRVFKDTNVAQWRGLAQRGT